MRYILSARPRSKIPGTVSGHNPADSVSLAGMWPVRRRMPRANWHDNSMRGKGR